MNFTFRGFLLFLVTLSAFAIVLFILDTRNSLKQKEEAQKAALASYDAAKVCYQAKMWDRAIESFQRAIQHASQAEDNLTIAKSYHTIAYIYNDNNVLDSVLVNYNLALDYYNKLPNVDLYKMQVLIGIGFVYDDLNKFDDAENYFKQSFDIAIQTGNKLYQGHGNQNLGLANLDRKDYNNALVYFQKALPDMQNAGDSIKIYINLSKLYTETHNLDSAAYYTSIVRDNLAQMTDNRVIAYSYSVLKGYYEKEGNSEEALHYSTLRDSVRKIIDNKNLIKLLNETDTEFATINHF